MSGQIIPISKVELSFRLATKADVPFMDSLQKRHGKGLGFFSTKQFEGYVEMEGVLIAEERTEDLGLRTESGGSASTQSSGLSPQSLGYIISRDRYLKRDELGVIFQLCVVPGMQRGYIGAALVREVFERSAYGCRLYCCWCAQDLEANYFWESVGFVPVAFRAGSDKKRRVHIFWQKRIVEGDTETKWWYPFQTTGGAIRADRIVFPIPTGTHWKDVQAVALPERARLPEPKKDTGRLPVKRKAKPVGLAPMGGFRFQSEVDAVVISKSGKVKTAKPQAAKIDPKYLKAARELRDRWLEQINSGGVGAYVFEEAGKYDVARQRHLSATATPVALLPAA